MPRVPVSAALLYVALGMACDGPQIVTLTAEDFRFVPPLVRVEAKAPITLLVYNAGREVHEFDSSALLYADRTSWPTDKQASGATGLLLRPGQSLRVPIAPPPGTYLYICRRKGHGDMTGTLIVE